MDRSSVADSKKRKTTRIGCIVAAALGLGSAVLVMVVGGFLLVNRALTDFDSYRDKMCIRSGLVVENADFRYSPGFDAAMWCRFTIRADGISEVSTLEGTNTSEFSQDAYEFQVDWIDDDWWNVDSHELIGGEVEVGKDFMRVAYGDNGDGTLTVYIFWFEV